LPLQKSKIVEVFAIASRIKEKARQTAERFNIPVYYGSYDALLKDKNIEFVYIPLPNHLHLEYIKKAANAGKHILCEKPLTLDSQQAEECIAYTRKKKVFLMEAFMYKFHPQWQRVKKLVQVDEIGEVNSVHTVFSYHNIDAQNIRNIKGMGGGGLMDIGCYAISVPRFLLAAEPIRVISLLTYDEVFKTDILTSALLDFGSSRASFTVSTKSFPWQWVEVLGTDGYITVKIPFNTFPDVPAEVIITTSVGSRIFKTEAVDQYQLQFEAFVRAVANKQPLPVPIEDAFDNMKVIDAVVKSAQTNSWENIK
jgi:predicted dehydrogenase